MFRLLRQCTELHLPPTPPTAAPPRLLLLIPPPPPPPLLPPAVATYSILPFISQTQADSRDGALESVGSGSSAKGNEKADTDKGYDEDRHDEDRHDEDDEDGHKRDGDRTAKGAMGIRDPPKRTADDAGLN